VTRYGGSTTCPNGKAGSAGKYVARYRAGTNLVLLSPDVAEYFPDEQSVNTALRTLIHAAKRALSAARAEHACQARKKLIQKPPVVHCVRFFFQFRFLISDF